jgi:hypothetical protein
MRRALVLGVVALAACGDKTPARKARDCFRYEAPAGWREQPSKTGADLVVMNPAEFSIGHHGMRDNFTVRYLPIALPLDAFVDQTIALMKRAAADASPTVTHLTFAGLPAMRVVVDTTIEVGGDSVPMHNTTTFVKLDDEVVSIATGYVASREATAGPAATKFLASISFDRCR